ncbi:MAG: thymidine phosphorylase [Proteobacteria bacterium]|nr:thymidine phosphorylase [Pseudomonadota bacterium]
MLFTDVIRHKRDGLGLSNDELDFFVEGLTDSSIPAEQVSALAMAVFLNGMTFEEAGRLTLGMSRSGTVLDWSAESLDGPVVDKHSTGGVGDKVSFLLAPIAAACGCYVPMISGRGLGHTGGTTDKVECIPGYQSMPDFNLFRKVVKSVGCAVIGQTNELAPADKRFYAIRDVTSTVESVPLITASILAKKIAAGLDGLVMDVKVGSGAFMPTLERATELANSIIGTAAAAGLKTHAILTDMNEVLGDTAGNAVEIVESVRYLRDEHRESRLDQVTLALCAEMLLLTGAETDRDNALRRVGEAVSSGRAAEKFDQMVAGLGGPTDFMDNYEKYLPVAPIIQPVYPTSPGVLSQVDAIQIGNAIIELGGGRRVLGETLDLAVGFTDIAHIGDTVDNTVPLAVIHAASTEQAQRAAGMIQRACVVSDSPVDKKTVIHKIITG